MSEIENKMLKLEIVYKCFQNLPIISNVDEGLLLPIPEGSLLLLRVERTGGTFNESFLLSNNTLPSVR